MKSSIVASRSLFLTLLVSASALCVELPRMLVFEYGEGHRDTTAFHIEISDRGELKAAMYSAPYPINDKPAKEMSSKRLTKAEWVKLVQLAIDADDFMVNGENFHGYNASIVFNYDSGKVRKECFGAEKWPPGPKTELFLVELKKHLPLNMRSEF